MHREVHILSHHEVFRKAIFRIEEYQLQHTCFDGSLSRPLTRMVLDRGDSVAALVHDLATDEIVLAEQFRLPTHERGPGWLVELPAGMVEAGEEPEACMRREVEEEVGFSIDQVQPISTVYLSPGGSSERVHVFYATLGQRVSEGGGVKSEGEDIRLVRTPAREAIRSALAGEIQDAKTLIAIQWLALRGLVKG